MWENEEIKGRAGVTMALENALTIGIVGLDTSHVMHFTRLLQDPADPFHVPGARVIAAYPGASADFPLSHTRVPEFQRVLESQYGVEISSSIEALVDSVDAVLLESVDGRVHLEQFRIMAPAGKPVFIDKPLAVSSQDADTICDLASLHQVPLLSTSALRYAESLTNALEALGEAVVGAECYGPAPWQPPVPGWFWYGIHAVEMLYRAMGPGCRRVRAESTPMADVLVGSWADGRLGVVRGNRVGNSTFGGTLHGSRNVFPIDTRQDVRPYYAMLLTEIVAMFHSGSSPLPTKDMREVIRFVEAANESVSTGHSVDL